MSVFGDLTGTVVPGFVDIQVNGGFGHDFTTNPRSIWEVGSLLLRSGVTAFVPTVITAPPEAVVSALEILAAGPPAGWVGAKPLGLHVEGPMIAPTRRGTHPVDLLLDPSLDLAERLVAAGPPLMVTIAPELAGADAVISRFIEAGTIVALGHSDCTADRAVRAMTLGARHVTHLYNAMSGLEHRSPGLAAAVLTDDIATAGLIADGVHVAPVMLHLAHRTLGAERIALVTDAMAAMGRDGGEHSIGSVPVTVSGIEIRNAAGALAGGAAPMDHLLRTMIDATGCSLDEAVAMASSTPARIVGHSPNAGDLTLLDADLAVVATAVDGTVVWNRP